MAELVNEIEDHAQEPPEQFVGDDAEYFETTQKNERAAKLYARLLARALVGTHESLMREAGERVAQATDGGVTNKPKRTAKPVFFDKARRGRQL